jgi:hypothetical protein
MEFLFSQTALLSIVTLVAIFGGMGWFAYKMYVLSGKPAANANLTNDKHSPQH